MASSMVDYSPKSVGLSRDDLLKFPFPYKLWILISLPTPIFLTWNSDGTSIQVNLQRLQEYLHSPSSIFVIKTTVQFLKHLKDFQFERINETINSNTDVELCYKHENFQRHRLDLVAKIRRVTFFNLDNAQNAELEATKPATTNLCAARMRGDLCFMEHGTLTEIQKKRIQSEITFAYTRESKVLQEKLKKAEAKINNSSNSRRGRSACLEREQVVVLPKDLYENPYDSVLAGKGGFQGYRYAGYYGNCTMEQINNFFGDYLPKYGEDGILKVKNFKDNSGDNSQAAKSFDLACENNSEPPNVETIIPDDSVPNVQDHFIEAENLITDNSNEASNFTEAASNINISASFDCNNGAMEFIVKPPFESSMPTNMAVNMPMNMPMNMSMNMPMNMAMNIPMNMTFNMPVNIPMNIPINMPMNMPMNMSMSTPMNMPIDTTNEISPPIAPQDVATPREVTNRPQEDNTDFYEDLRATFELLQNQPF